MATTKTQKKIAAKNSETDTTIVEQLAYYRILAPLEVRSLLSRLDLSGKKSISLDLKQFKNRDLEPFCNTFIEGLDKQAKHFTEASEKEEASNYKVDFVEMQKKAFNLFEETVHIYGIPDDGIRLPVEEAKSDELKIRKNEVVYMNSESTLLLIKSLKQRKGSRSL